MNGKRYAVLWTDRGCCLTLFGEHGYTGQTSEHEFFTHESGGYVFEETPDRPGTTGRQVCESSLFGLGSTLTVASRESLPAAIRKLARRHCDATDRGER